MLLEKINSRDNIILSFLKVWLLVDCLNGFFLTSGIPIPISKIYKPIIALMIVLWHTNNRKIVNVGVACALYIIIWSVFIIFADSSVVESITLVLKPITTLLIFYFFRYLFTRYDNNLIIKEYISIVKINAIVLFVNILLGLFDIGYHSYGGESEMGFCGFFYSPNELSGVVAVIFPLVLAYYKINKSRLAYLLVFFIMGVVAMLLSTKSPIIILLFSLALISYFYGSKLEKRIVFIAAMALIIVIYTYIQIILNSEYGIIQRLNFFIQRDGFWDAITSGRWGYWEERGVDFYNASLINQVFGLGGNRTVEMDPFDMLLNCGYVGVFLLAILYVRMLFYPRKVKNKYVPAIITSNSLLVFMSILSGHILFSSMAGVFIALSNSLIFYRENSLNFSCHDKRSTDKRG